MEETPLEKARKRESEYCSKCVFVDGWFTARYRENCCTPCASTIKGGACASARKELEGMANEKRLIDADALKAKAKLRGIVSKGGKIVFRKCITLEDIDNAPAVEVKPVAEEKPKTVHARWYQHCFEMYCSNCHEEAPRVYIDKYTVEY